MYGALAFLSLAPPSPLPSLFAPGAPYPAASAFLPLTSLVQHVHAFTTLSRSRHSHAPSAFHTDPHREEMDRRRCVGKQGDECAGNLHVNQLELCIIIITYKPICIFSTAMDSLANHWTFSQPWSDVVIVFT